MRCPCCKGEGGYTDVITDEGQGPYYPCDFCNDETTVSLWRWWIWQWDCVILPGYIWRRFLCLFGRHSKSWFVSSHSAQLKTVTYTCVYCDKRITVKGQGK